MSRISVRTLYKVPSYDGLPYPGFAPTESDLIIFPHNDKAFVRDGLDGAIVAQEPDLASAFSKALQHLDPDRKTKETIYINGDFEAENIPLESHLRVVINGRLKLKSGASTLFSAVGSKDAHLTDIEIVGGHLLGDFPEVDGQRGIYAQYVDELLVHYMTLEKFYVGCYVEGVESSEDNKFIRCVHNLLIDNDYGLIVKWGRYIDISNNMGHAPNPEPYSCFARLDLVQHYAVNDNVFYGADIIILVSTSSHGRIDGNVLGGGRGGGIAVCGDNWHVGVTSNTIHDMQKEGIECRQLHYGDVSDNVLYNNGYAGLRIWNTRHTSFIGNILCDNGYALSQEHPWYAQLTLFQENNNPLAEGNIFAYNILINRNRLPDYQVRISAAPEGHTWTPGKNFFYYNKFDSANLQVVYLEGDSEFKFNEGWPTENSGTATFSGDGSKTSFTIPHGLISAPSEWYITPTSPDAAGEYYVTADDQNLTINFKTAPPAGTDNLKFKWRAYI